MKRDTTTRLAIAVATVIAVVWIARHTYWDNVEVPTLPKGEALTNPFYATQRFAEALGARTTHDRVFTTPPPDAVLVLSVWNWNVSDRRREAIERWVAAGGRLVVDRGLMDGSTQFEKWSGIARKERKIEVATTGVPHLCDRFHEERGNGSPAGADTRLHWLCDFDSQSTLTTAKQASWSLTGDQGAQAMRVTVGRGSVSVINGWPFRERAVFDGDHGWLFVTASEMRRGDEIHFLSEEDHPSLLSLIWLQGKPVVIVALILVAFMLWRDSVRLGPLAAAPARARRSLAEQIRGTGRFTLQLGGGEVLHGACARALEEAAARRVSGYQHLNARERATAIAALTGFDRDGLNATIYHPGLRQAHELRHTIERLETVRRMLIPRIGRRHGHS